MRIWLVSLHVVATVDEIAPGTHKLVTVKGREIGIFNVKGDFYALFNRCPHAGGSLCATPSDSATVRVVETRRSALSKRIRRAPLTSSLSSMTRT